LAGIEGVNLVIRLGCIGYTVEDEERLFQGKRWAKAEAQTYLLLDNNSQSGDDLF
jgi:hypothetical protein